MLVSIEQNEIVNSSYQSDEEYGDWNRDSTMIINKVSKHSRIKYIRSKFIMQEIYEVNAELKDAQEQSEIKIHVVTLIYGTGDSFGHSTGNGLIIWAFTDILLAEKCRANVKGNYDENAFCFEVEDGEGSTKMIQLSNPAAGYFDDFEEVKVETFDLGFELENDECFYY
jgi:hypothetical protein